MVPTTASSACLSHAARAPAARAGDSRHAHTLARILNSRCATNPHINRIPRCAGRHLTDTLKAARTRRSTPPAMGGGSQSHTISHDTPHTQNRRTCATHTHVASSSRPVPTQATSDATRHRTHTRTRRHTPAQNPRRLSHFSQNFAGAASATTSSRLLRSESATVNSAGCDESVLRDFWTSRKCEGDVRDFMPVRIPWRQVLAGDRELAGV